MLSVPGLRPEKVLRLYKDLGITSLAELEGAAKEDRIKKAAELQCLKPLIRKTQPYAKKIAHRGAWVELSVLAEIEYRAKSAEGKVRHPFFKGIREDL
jgi:ATP-dependent DNA ligase